MKTELKGRYRSGLLLAAAAVALAAAGWLSLSSPSPALAQIPDSGAQRLEMIKELREVNRNLTEIAGLLREMRDDARKDRTEKRAGAGEKKLP